MQASFCDIYYNKCYMMKHCLCHQMPSNSLIFIPTLNWISLLQRNRRFLDHVTFIRLELFTISGLFFLCEWIPHRPARPDNTYLMLNVSVSECCSVHKGHTELFSCLRHLVSRDTADLFNNVPKNCFSVWYHNSLYFVHSAVILFTATQHSGSLRV